MATWEYMLDDQGMMSLTIKIIPSPPWGDGGQTLERAVELATMTGSDAVESREIEPGVYEVVQEARGITQSLHVLRANAQITCWGRTTDLDTLRQICRSYSSGGE